MPKLLVPSTPIRTIATESLAFLPSREKPFYVSFSTDLVHLIRYAIFFPAENHECFYVISSARLGSGPGGNHHQSGNFQQTFDFGLATINNRY